MKYVWLESSDAVHEICRAESCSCAGVFDTKKAVLRYWKDLGDVELLGEKDFPVDQNTIAAVWHRINGENVLMVAKRRAVNTCTKGKR